MKKAKKVISFMLVMVMAAGLLVMNADAAAAKQRKAVAPKILAAAGADSASAAKKGLAYMDLDSAPASLRGDILAARRKIIYGEQGWTVNGAVSIRHSDGTVEKLPEFSELFPGWDVPADEDLAWRVSMMAGVSSTNAGTVDWYGNCQLPVANNWVNSKEFYTFVGTGNYVYVYASTGPLNSSYNIGFSEGTVNVGWCPHLVVRETGARIMTRGSSIYGVRGSVNAGASDGWHRIYVSSTPGPITSWDEP